MSLTDYGEAYALDATLNTTNKWICLFIVNPNEAGASATEVTGAGYARIATTWDPAVPSVMGAPATKNPAADVAFGPASADWAVDPVKIVGYGVADALSGGNIVWVGTLGTPREVLNGDTPTFPAAALTFKME